VCDRVRRRVPWLSSSRRRESRAWGPPATSSTWAWHASSSAKTRRSPRCNEFSRRFAHAESTAHGARVRRGGAARHARLVRRAGWCRATPRARPGGWSPLPLPQQASEDRQGALVRRVRVVCAGEALGGRELSAAAVRRKQAAGRDRRGGVRVAAGRDRLHGGAAWLVSAFSARKALKRIDMERQV